MWNKPDKRKSPLDRNSPDNRNRLMFAALSLLLFLVVIFLFFDFAHMDGYKEITSVPRTDQEKGEELTSEMGGFKEPDFSFEDNETVTLKNREEAPREKKYEGVTLTVAAPMDRMADFLHKDGMEWARQNGVHLIVEEIPFSQIFENAAYDIIKGENKYDIILYPSYLMGDLVETGKLVPFDSFIDLKTVNGSYSENGLEWDSYYPHYSQIYNWYGDHIYALNVDGDVFITAYRKDLWVTYGKEFEQSYGYALRPDDPLFPETWEEYYDIAEFFNKKGLSGTAEVNARSRGSAWHFLVRYVSYMKKDGMYNGDAYFELETMKPLINSEAGVRAMEDIVSSVQGNYSSEEMRNLNWTDMQNNWGAGKIALLFTWPATYDIARRDVSVLPGRAASTGYAMIPGSREVFNVQTNSWESGEEIHRATMLGHGWQFSIINTCQNQEAAYDLVRFMTTGDRLIHNVQKVYWEYEPLKTWEWQDETILAEYSDAQSFLPALDLGHRYGVPDLRIPGAIQMYDAIEIYKRQAIEGKMTPREAVNAIAADWEKIVKQRGVGKMQKSYLDTVTPRDIYEVLGKPDV